MSVASKPVPEVASAARPDPAAVRGNDWRRVAAPAPAAFRPALPVSVVVPCFEAPGALALTLAGLQRQDYPRALFEVVVVDDGSFPPLRVPASTALRVRTVRQERRGFGLARARNAGARAALHDILVFLDGDVIAEAGLLAAPRPLAPRGLGCADARLLRQCVRSRGWMPRRSATARRRSRNCSPAGPATRPGWSGTWHGPRTSPRGTTMRSGP